MATAKEFRQVLFDAMSQTERKGSAFLEITAGELHQRAGGYPGRNHRMPMCCRVMKTYLSEAWGDCLLDESLTGQGPDLRIRYKIPRPQNEAVDVSEEQPG